MELTREFINNRISKQFVYCLEILKSDRSSDRKMELIESAMLTAVNFARQIGDIETIIFLGMQLVSYSLQATMILGKPRPKKFEIGGVISEDGKSVIRPGVKIENSLDLPLYK